MRAILAGTAALTLCLALVAQSHTPRSALGAVPLFFEANGGRYDSDAAFVARGRGYQLFLSANGSALALRHSDGQSGFAAAVHTRFVGADPAPRIRGEGELETRIHYLVGPRSDWSTNNKTFARVRYDAVWPGIDLVMYSRDGELEFDFIVAPGVDPAAIRLRYDGVDGMRLDEGGDLLLTTGNDELTVSAPVLYQEIDGVTSPVGGRFTLDDGVVGFEVDAYDTTRPLVIDPVLVYASYLAGTGTDCVCDVATDAAGSAYVCGWTDSTDLPGTAGTFQPNKAPGGVDAMVAKISRDGRSLLWCTYLGGNDFSPDFTVDADRAFAIDVDAGGHAYVGGKTTTRDFPVTVGAFQSTLGPASDGFVAKLAPDGTALVYSTYLGASGSDHVAGLDVDALGHAHVTGAAGHRTFPTTAGSFQSVITTPRPIAFVTKLDPTGGALVYSTFLTGLDPVTGSAGRAKSFGADIHIDSSGRAYVAGVTDAVDFPTVNAFQSTNASVAPANRDGFLVRLSADGSAMEYGTYLGGSSQDGSFQDWAGVAADDSGRAWFASMSASLDYPTTPGAYQTTRAPGINSFNAVVTCLDTNAAGAASMIWSTYLGSNLDVAWDVEVDAAQNAYVLGHTQYPSSFPLVEPWQTRSTASEMFVTVFDSSGAVPFSSLFGGNSAEVYGGGGSQRTWLAGMALDFAGNIYLAGSTGSTDLATPGSFQSTKPTVGGSAGFVAKFSALDSDSDFTVRMPCAGSAPPQSLRPLSGAVLGQDLSVAIGDPVGTLQLSAGTLAIWLVAFAPDSQYPCGTLLPGIGELLISVTPAPVALVAGSLDGATRQAIYTIPVPNSPRNNGINLFTQGVLWDVSAPQVVLTDALDITLGR